MSKFFKINSTNATSYGIIFMLINTMSLTLLDISAKILRADFKSSLIVFIYKFTLLLFVIPWIIAVDPTKFKTKKLHFHIIRSFFGTIGALCFMHGLKHVSMADAAALENIQYILVICLGVMFFGEKLTKTKCMAIVCGFLGALIVVRPEILSFSPSASSNSSSFTGYMFILAAVSFWSVNTITVKVLGNTEHNKTQMFYLLLFASIWSFPAALINWNQADFFGFSLPLSPEWVGLQSVTFNERHLMFLGLMGLCYFTHGVAYFYALRKTELSIVIPFRYSKLLFSAMLGYIIFGEKVTNINSYLGYSLILAASFMLIRYEIRRKKRAQRKALEESQMQNKIKINQQIANAS